MSKLSHLIVGVALGFIAAHFVNQTPKGQQFFDRVNRSAREFSDAVATGYHEAESELGDVLDNVERRLAKLESNR